MCLGIRSPDRSDAAAHPNSPQGCERWPPTRGPVVVGRRYASRPARVEARTARPGSSPARSSWHASRRSVVAAYAAEASPDSLSSARARSPAGADDPPRPASSVWPSVSNPRRAHLCPILPLNIVNASVDRNPSPGLAASAGAFASDRLPPCKEHANGNESEINTAFCAK